MAKRSGRRMRKWVRVLLLALALLLAAASTFSATDRLAGLVTPQSLLRVALPMLYGLDVPEEIHHAEDDDTTPENPESTPGKDEIHFEVMEPDEEVSDKIRIELMGAARNETIDLSGDKPRVLIFHTHTTEAYTPTEQYPYEEKWDDFRTDKNDRNVVALGEKLGKLLREEYGISVIHDTTDHEPPSLRTSYNRSYVTLENYLKKYPSIDLFIDVHRDAYTLKEGEKNSDYVTIDGKKVARLMFVVGTGEGKTGAGFSKKPNYKQNYALALSITDKLKEVNPKLAKPIRVKTGRYTQHIPGRSLLVEIGHNANTFEEASAAVPYLAKAIAQSAGIQNEK